MDQREPDSSQTDSAPADQPAPSPPSVQHTTSLANPRRTRWASGLRTSATTPSTRDND